MTKLIELSTQELDLVSGGTSCYYTGGTSHSYNTKYDFSNIGNNNGNNNSVQIGNGNGINVSLTV